MADAMVEQAQRFINSYDVDGIPKVEVNGKTSWTVMYALTRALQHELGMTTLADSFGPATLAALQSRFPVIDGNTRNGNIYRIVQSGLYCKGYDGDQINGDYTERVSASVTSLKRNMGVDAAYPGDSLTPKVFKALLTMDAYVLVDGGTDAIRSVEQWLNSRYIGRRDFFVIPCDGNFSRDVQKALIYAIQYEIGMSDDVATGALGPATKQGLRDHTVAQGSTGVWVGLFSAAMLFNRRPGAAFTTTFDAGLAAGVRDFQSFVRLPVNGQGDFPTWASLLVSTGDNTRAGTACDTVTELTAPRAAALYSAGYRYIGRYLSNVPGSTLNKQLQPGELKVIAAQGLNVFPIYQTYGGEAAYFRREQGVADAHAAIERARHYGFKAGTRIYFAVDFDALDHEVTDSVLPHFRGIKATVDEYGPEYRIGIYAPRNVCSRVGAEGLTSASFLSDMSTGFSGNLGFPHPVDWSFDQIATISAGSGAGAISIDNDIASGRDLGQSSFLEENDDSHLDGRFDTFFRDVLLADVQNYMVNSMGVPEQGGEGGMAYSTRTTTQSFQAVMDLDWLTTSVSRTYGMRKALIQCPLLWEIRAYNIADKAADDAVEAGLKDDSSTGLGQIRAHTGIDARNYCVDAGIITGRIMSTDSSDDLSTMWHSLHDDDVYNVSTIPAVLVQGAALLGIARPTVDSSTDDSRRIMGRYNGTGDGAERYGNAMIGLFAVFEKYNSLMRD
ncbi:glycoside hydrolase domain-containing protein [Streptomyces sp. NBC_00696]|uniref:glycoside hydrolase domain-containing protein n=1 Tax=Streptomyces sp. NBC_00696 TaxID=2903672 RepID=UPI002E3610DA|nr:glycoside hydrolase domain-containing protein [Streptomyces sp. NBC_00696]